MVQGLEQELYQRPQAFNDGVFSGFFLGLRCWLNAVLLIDCCLANSCMANSGWRDKPVIERCFYSSKDHILIFIDLY